MNSDVRDKSVRDLVEARQTAEEIELQLAEVCCGAVHPLPKPDMMSGVLQTTRTGQPSQLQRGTGSGSLFAALGTTRAGGAVRAALYSHDPLLYWSWCRSDIEMSRFLMHYIGGGTRFPFDLLRKSCAECLADQPIRVVISDHDFDANYSSHPENREIFIAAANQSAHWILMLHQPAPAQVQLYRTLGASVIVLEDLANFPRMATELTTSLFPDSV